MKKKILVVDDDIAILNILELVLKNRNYGVLLAENAEQAEKHIENNRIDAIILDRILPGTDGISILKHIRMTPSSRRIPVIVLSGKDEREDKIHGLEMGADDYVTKPFDKDELIARLEAVFRRMQLDDTKGARKLAFGDIEIDLDQHQVQGDGTTITFRPKEYDLLVLLASNPGRVFSREEILEKIWGYENLVETRTVDVHIQKVRKKIGHNEILAPWIETVRGYGYKFNPNA